MLEVAAAATAVKSAGRVHTPGCGGMYVNRMAEQEPFFPVADFYGDSLIGQGKTDQHHRAVGSSGKPIAAVDDLGYGDNLIIAVHGPLGL